MVKKILFTNRLQLLGLFVLLILASATNAISAVIFMIVWNAMMGVGPFSLTQAFIIFITMDTFTALVAHAYKITKNNYIQNGMTQLREDVFSKLLDENCEDAVGKKISILNNDINVIDESYLNGIFRFLNICCTILISGITFFVLSWQMALITIAISLATLFIPNLISSKIKDKQMDLSQHNASMVAMINDYFNGSSLIHAFHAKKEFMYNFKQENKDYRKSKVSFLNSISIAESGSNFLGVVIFGSTMLIGAWMVHSSLLQMGVFIAAIQLTNSFSFPVTMAIQEYVKITGSKPIMKKLEDILNTATQEDEHQEWMSLSKLSLQDVSYAYNPEQPVLNHIQFDVEKGKKYLIIGESGSGKTTLLNILRQKLNDYKGTIYFNQKNIKDCSLTSFKNTYSVVDQNVFIFNDTLRHNLTLYQPFDDSEIMDVLEKVNLTNKVSLLDESLEENGKILSGGEKQRIAIARALLHRSQLLFLDEATSSLDISLANDIENLVTNLDDITVVSVSHRISEAILHKYDEVIVLEHGEMSYCGKYENEQDNAYIQSLLQIQNRNQ